MTPEIRLGRAYRFFAAHRLHNPSWSNEDNRRIYGKCNHDNGHGHTYYVDVIVSGPMQDDTDWIMDLGDLDREVNQVLDTIAYHQIEEEVPGLVGRRSTTENVADYLYRKIEPRLQQYGTRLVRLEVAETRNNQFEVERRLA